MLVNLQTVLAEAQKNKYAVGAFNVYSYETIKGVLEVAEEKQTPVILAFGEKYLTNMDFETVVAIVKSVGKNMTVPFALHLDHCMKMDNVFRAIAAGFTSVMYDGSALPYEENVANTAKVVEVAHASNVSVEAELGSLATGANSHEGTAEDVELFTDPSNALDFVTRTKVDALAVSIGTVHGMYKGEPNIRVDILKKLREKIEIPMVLHGGSGTPEDKIKECIQNGICKINVNTEISVFTVNKVKELLAASGKMHLSELSVHEIPFIKEVVLKYMQVFK